MPIIMPNDANLYDVGSRMSYILKEQLNRLEDAIMRHPARLEEATDLFPYPGEYNPGHVIASLLHFDHYAHSYRTPSGVDYYIDQLLRGVALGQFGLEVYPQSKYYIEETDVTRMLIAFHKWDLKRIENMASLSSTCMTTILPSRPS